jgi:dUTP pyrophosphatase
MKIMLDNGAILPTRAHLTDAGLDLYARETRGMEPGQLAVFDTGVHMEFPHGYYGKIESKSGLNIKYGVVSCGGVIDEGFTGSITVKLYNLSQEPYIVSKGDKIAQLVIQPYATPKLEIVDELADTPRGTAGFGSTGK